jgi:preprotein translocase subunit SecE
MTQPSQKKMRFKFFRDVFAELKKVTWPTWRQTAYLTTVVIATCLVVGLFLGGLDFGLTQAVKALVN